jgi:hemerythrin-like domain-containing protein
VPSGIYVAKKLLKRMHMTGTLSMAVRDRFGADHHELESLFGSVLDAFEANDREGIVQLWNEFDDRLGKHLDAEERFLIPQVFAARPREARTILEEHWHIRSRLVELGCRVDLHTARLETARGFIDDLRAHARHEDEILYQWADGHLPASEQRTLVAALTAPLQDRLHSA